MATLEDIMIRLEEMFMNIDNKLNEIITIHHRTQSLSTDVLNLKQRLDKISVSK